MSPWSAKYSPTSPPSASDPMPFAVTKQEKFILGVLAALVILGHIGLLVL